MIVPRPLEQRAQTSPWVIGIIIGFILLLLVNAGFIYIAVRGADQIVPSYRNEER